MSRGGRSIFYSLENSRSYFTFCFISNPDLKTTTFRGGTGTLCPVRGLRPKRARRSLILKTPKLRNSTLSPFIKESTITSKVFCTIFLTSTCLMPVASAILKTMSFFVIKNISLTRSRLPRKMRWPLVPIGQGGAPSSRNYRTNKDLQCQQLFNLGPFLNILLVCLNL